jgi:hypothetical protein
VLHQVGVSFDLYYDARKHKIKMKEKISWSERVRNEEVLQRVKEKRNILHILYRVYIVYLLDPELFL